MKIDIKTVSTTVGLVLLLMGTTYKSITYVNARNAQINTNTSNIAALDLKVTLDSLEDLYRRALSDYYYWDEQCNKTKRASDCKRRDEAKKRVRELEDQINGLKNPGGTRNVDKTPSE